MQTRAGETAKTWFRSDRFYTVGNNWFATTREGNDVGPFLSRQQAASAVKQYVCGVRAHKNSRVQARSVATDVWASSNFI